MPDAKRKLPVVAIDTGSLALLQIHGRHGRLIVWPCADDDPFDTVPEGTTRYEPAVPRCRTCDNWELEEWTPGQHFCYSNDSSSFGPDDFCSKHQPRK